MVQSSKLQAFQLLLAAIILLAILVGIFLLAWHKTVSGGEALAVITTILGVVGGAFALHAGVNAGAKAATTTTDVSPTQATKLPD